MNISYSFLSKMRSCPFRASQKAEADPLRVAKGKIVHEAIESRAKHGGSLEKNLDFSMLDSLNYAPLAESTLKKYGAKTPRQYIENQVFQSAQWLEENLELSPFSVHEKLLVSEWKGCTVKGYVDIIDGRDIYDIKVTENLSRADPLQAAMYAWLCDRNEIRIEHFYFVFPLRKKIVEVDVRYDELFKLMDRASIYITSGRYPAIPQNCDGCECECPLFRRT